MIICAEGAELGAGVVVRCTRWEGHPLPHEAPVVLERSSGLVGRVQWPHVAVDVTVSRG